jgi:hypothetical protein
MALARKLVRLRVRVSARGERALVRQVTRAQIARAARLDITITERLAF